MLQNSGFRVQGSEFRIQGSVFRVEGVGFTSAQKSMHCLGQPPPRPEAILRLRWDSDQLLQINVQRFRGGLVFKARRLLHHSRHESNI